MYLQMIFLFVFMQILIKVGGDLWLPPGYEFIPDPKFESLEAIEKCGFGSRVDANKYKCVPYYECESKVIIPKNTLRQNEEGFDVVYIRLSENQPLCPNYLEVCCKMSNISKSNSSTNKSLSNKSSSHLCGIRNLNGIDFTLEGKTNEVEFGEFPWTVAIFAKKQRPNDSNVLCGGTLIHPSVVVTAAHCVYGLESRDINVRAGDWDLQTTKERLPYQERNIQQIIIHELFNPDVLYNDLALLILDYYVSASDHIGTICLPNHEEVINSENCFAVGWGSSVFGNRGLFQQIMKKVQLSTIEQHHCEYILKTQTRLNKFFNLHYTFMCASTKEKRKDTCWVHDGSPLVCSTASNPERYILAGIYSWGIFCTGNLPDVYTDVAQFREWINKKMRKLSFSTETYTV